LHIKREVQQVLENIKKEQGIVADLELYVTDEWSEVSEEEYVSISVKDAHNQIFGSPAESVYFSWSSDANILTRHGIIAVNYGPSGGPGKETRGTMYIPNLVKCAQVYTLSSMDICSKTSSEVRKMSPP